MRRERGPSPGYLLKETWNDSFVYGVRPVLAALAARRRKVYALYIQEDVDGLAREVRVLGMRNGGRATPQSLKKSSGNTCTLQKKHRIY